jgi:hypothetical protein
MNVFGKDSKKVSKIFSLVQKMKVEVQFEELMKILNENDFEIILLLCKLFVSTSEKDNFLESIVSITQRSGEEALLRLLKISIEQEVNECWEPSTLFRSNVVSSKLIKFYSQKISHKYLITVVSDIVRQITKNPDQYQLNENKLKPGYNLADNLKNVSYLLDLFIKNFKHSISVVPFTWRKICKYLYETIEKKFKSNDGEIFEPKHFAVGGFIILRVINPAIVSPYQFGISSEKPSPECTKILIEFSRILQNFSNGMLNSIKDKHLLPFQEKSEKWIMELKDIYIELASDPTTHVTVEYDVTDELESSYWIVKKLISKNLDLFKKKESTLSELQYTKLCLILKNIEINQWSPEFIPNFQPIKSKEIRTKEDNVLEFCTRCYHLLCLSYSTLIEHVFEKITSVLDYTLFNFDYENPLITPFKRIDPFEMKNKTDFGLSFLDKVKSIFVKIKIHKQIYNHFFETIIQKLDSYICNLFMSVPEHAKRAVEIKVGMSYFETWYQDEKIKCNDQEGKSLIFKYSRECINVCIVSEKDVLSDDSLRKMICPNLDQNQIEILLKNVLGKDNFKRTIKEEELNEVFIHKSVHFNKRTDLESGKLVSTAVFDLDFGVDFFQEMMSEIQFSDNSFDKQEFDFLK